MKYIVIVPDGMGDLPIESLEGKTPLEASKTPNMNFFAKEGKVGLVQTTPRGMTPGSDVNTLSLLGYDPTKHYTGRAALEAANMGLQLKKDEIAFRCNFVTEYDGKMSDYSSGHISTEESRILIQYLDEKLGSDTVQFYPGISYRHVLILKTKNGVEEFSAKCNPPHDIIGKPLEQYFPVGNGEEFLKELMLKAKSLIQNHEINIIRADLKENPANMIWLWSQGVTPDLIPFREKYDLNGALISAVDLVNGIGKIAGLETIRVPGATGYYDTDYAAKGAYAIEALQRKDFVLVHIEATDQAGHSGDLREKVRAIENIDYHIVGAVRKYVEQNPETRVLIAPNHATPVDTRGHLAEPVPFVIAGSDIQRDDIETFCESAAKYSSLKFNEGCKLMEYFCSGERLEVSS